VTGWEQKREKKFSVAEGKVLEMPLMAVAEERDV